jgi:hypothetical protein
VIWLAVSVFLICATVLVIGWRAEPHIRKLITLAERPKPDWQHGAWRTTVVDAVSQVVEVLHDRPASVLPTLADKAVPLVERWLSLRETEFAEAHKPAPAPKEVPILPPDLVAAANRESEPWAREAAAAALQELGIKLDGDWGKVRAYALTDPSGNS